jgi:transglutaminase-like putative cysteine protease
MSKPQRFIGDINPDTNDYDAEYIRIAKWLDQFLPKEPIKTYDIKLTDSNLATYESVEVIKNLIDEGKKDIVVRTLAEKLTQYIKPKDYKKEIYAIYNFVTRRLRYTKDIHRVETVHSARELLRRHRKAADCDDFVILTGALLQAVGHAVRIVIIGNNPSDKEDYSHIYLQTRLKNRWVALDGSVPGAAVGWEAPKYATKKIITLDGETTTFPPRSNWMFWVLIAAVVACLATTKKTIVTEN